MAQKKYVWVTAINENGSWGQWCFDVVFEPAQTRDVIGRYGSTMQCVSP